MFRFFCFCFFKQKTAYEMRISDWSSDVCSSDLTIIVLLSFFCLAGSSCDDMLKETPFGVYSNENYYNTENDALNALLYAYDPINNIEYGARFLFNLTDITTNQYKSYNKGLETNLYTWDVTPNTEEFLYFFKYAYLSISRANSVLENVSKMKNISGSLQKQFLGAARFLSAFNYFMLVRAFGIVPMHDNVAEGVDQGQAPYASIEALNTFLDRKSTRLNSSP